MLQQLSKEKLDNLATLQLIRFAKEVLVDWETTATNLDNETE